MRTMPITIPDANSEFIGLFGDRKINTMNELPGRIVKSKKKHKIKYLDNDPDYVERMVRKIESIYNAHPDARAEKMDEIIFGDSDIKQFASDYNSVMAVACNTVDNDRFKKLYKLIDMKRRMNSGEVSESETRDKFMRMDLFGSGQK